jgi:hypothetical protein
VDPRARLAVLEKTEKSVPLPGNERRRRDLQQATNFQHSRLGGAVVSVLATGPKGRLDSSCPTSETPLSTLVGDFVTPICNSVLSLLKACVTQAVGYCYWL